MSINKKSLTENVLTIVRVGTDGVVLTNDAQEIVLPPTFLGKSLEAGDKIVLSTELESDAMARKTKTAKEILNEVLKP